MKIPVRRLMSAFQNEFVESALRPLAALLGVDWDFVKGEESDGLVYLCGLPASRLLQTHAVVGAPVLSDGRYLDQPVYFTDVLAARNGGQSRWESPSGAVWAYNGQDSFSGWVAVLDGLRRRGIDPAAFRWVETGSHANSLKLLVEGRADLSGVDSMIWDHQLQVGGSGVDQIINVDSFGPWPMPPLMAARTLGVEFLNQLKQAMREATRHDHPGPIARWAIVDDSHLDPIIEVTRTLRDRTSIP